MATISKATVISIKQYGSEIREYLLQLEKNNYFEAGSFLQLTLDTDKDFTRWPDSRNFSIASAHNEEGIIKLIIRKVGEYTGRIFNELSIGSVCTVKYAFGDFLLPFFEKKPLIYCIAGGTGIAPVLGFCEQLKKQGLTDNFHVYYSFKNESEFIGHEFLAKNTIQANLHLFSSRQEIKNILNRRITFEDIDIDLKILSKSYFYICGGETFTRYFVEKLKGINAENIFTDEW